MLSYKKKVGIGLVLCGVASLILAFIGIPLGWSAAVKRALVIAGVAMVVAALPLMWADGIRNLRSWPKINHLHRMRQSGFFDIAMIFAVLALVLLALGVFGKITYGAALTRFAGAGVKTLEEARLVPEFVEYNFRQALNPFANHYHVLLNTAGITLAAVVICLLYMRFVSPIVAADDALRIAHGVYRKVGQTALSVFITLVMLFPIYWMVISSFKTSTELLASVPTLWPKEFVWENYPNVLRRAPFIRYLINTLVTTC